MTTLTEFVTAVAGLTIAGVNTQYTYEPVGVETADLPASFVRLPDAQQNDATLTTCSDGGHAYTMFLVVVLEPTNQEQPSELWSDTVTMADNMMTPLKALGTMPIMSWSLSCTSIVMKNDVEYAAVVATITGQE